MKSTFKLAASLAVLVALLALTSSAMAKGGGGGGGGNGGGGGGAACATIDALTVDPTPTGGAINAVVTMGCFDEHSGAVAFDYKNASGVVFGRSVIMSSLGTRTYSLPTRWPSDAGPATTVTVTVTAPNGKVQDTRSIAIGSPTG